MDCKRDEEIIEQIVFSLDELDKSIKVNTPDLAQIRKLVDRVEDKKQKRNNLQFLIFAITASILVSIEAIAFSGLSIEIFIGVQLGALLFIPIFAFMQVFNRRRQVNRL